MRLFHLNCLFFKDLQGFVEYKGAKHKIFVEGSADEEIDPIVIGELLRVNGCSGPLKLDSRNRQNYSSELGDHL